MAYQISTTNDRSSLGIGESMNIFQMPAVDVGVSKVRYVDFQPKNHMSKTLGMEFVITNLGNQYIDLRRTYLKLKVRILQNNDVKLPKAMSGLNTNSYAPTDSGSGSDGTDPPVIPTIPEASKVGPVNNFMHSLFSQIDVYFQNKLVSSSNDNYAYEAYFNTLFNHFVNSKGTHLMAQLFCKDVAPMDSGDINGTNVGLVTRAMYTRESRTLDLMGPLLLDIFTINKYILNGVEIKLKFWPSNSRFHLMSDATSPDFHVELVDACLSVCIVTPTREMLISHQEVMQKENYMAVYQYMKSDIKKYSVAGGLLQFRVDNVYLGNVPSRLICGIVSEEGVSGSYTRNPFNFYHNHVRYVNVSVDNESIPTSAYQMKFDDENSPYGCNFVDAYLSLFGREREFDVQNSGPSITRSDYAKGYTLFAYDLEPDVKNEDDGMVWPTFKRGNLRIEIHFEKKLTEPVCIILFATFPSMIKIDHARAVYIA